MQKKRSSKLKHITGPFAEIGEGGGGTGKSHAGLVERITSAFILPEKGHRLWTSPQWPTQGGKCPLGKEGREKGEGESRDQEAARSSQD